jgi:protein-tyrosine phosphatase
MLGITALPGRGDLGRSLPEDLLALYAERLTHIVPLITDQELLDYGVEGLFSAYQQAGWGVHRLPIPDMGVCSLEEMAGLVAWLEERLAAGDRVLIHCVGGLGRSGMAVACYLASRGLSAQAAIDAVRRARSPHAIETLEQESFVQRFAHQWGAGRASAP